MLWSLETSQHPQSGLGPWKLPEKVWGKELGIYFKSHLCHLVADDLEQSFWLGVSVSFENIFLPTSQEKYMTQIWSFISEHFTFQTHKKIMQAVNTRAVSVPHFCGYRGSSNALYSRKDSQALLIVLRT